MRHPSIGWLEAHTALAVVAHPDDESFGLGGLLPTLIHTGVRVHALCFTHGEASTLGDDLDLYATRALEFAGAADALGLAGWRLLDHPDGHLDATPAEELAHEVVADARRIGADLLVVFDDGGVTGHPDHQRATEAAIVAAERLDLAVLAWSVADPVATVLNAELGTSFCGRGDAEIDEIVTVDRDRQHAAIACHHSQAEDNPVLRRRLELTGDTEPVRWLRRTSTPSRA